MPNEWGIWCLDPRVDCWVEENRFPCRYPSERAAKRDLKESFHFPKNYEVRQHDKHADGTSAGQVSSADDSPPV